MVRQHNLTLFFKIKSLNFKQKLQMYKKLFIISSLCALIAIYLNLSNFFSFFSSQTSAKKTLPLFTENDLKLYNGIDNPELYLSVLGKIFNVTKGSKHYGPGGSYNFFIGKDSSRSFVTGKFGENDVDDKVSDLSQEELRSLNHWVQFYRKEYNIVGKLIGRYYDSNGKLTRYGKEVKKLIKAAEQAKESEHLEKLKYPPCNVEWDANRGTRVWCTDKSGGITRDWVGVPRQLYEPGSQDFRCACVQSNELTANLKQYEGCDSDSSSCFVK